MHSTNFKINEYLSLRLEEGETVIYVAEKVFQQCKYLLLNIPIEDITILDEFDSIDKISETLDDVLEDTNEDLNDRKIPPEVEFWGHCSNLQAWYENDYQTKFLHSNLAFPLLKKLTEVGDPLAKIVFKEEIAKRYNSGSDTVRKFLEMNGYLDYLTIEELFSVLDTEYDIVSDLMADTDEDWLKIEFRNGKVTGLIHHGFKLDKVPNPIRRLANLKKLDLRHNLIKEIPEWISELQSIKELYFSNNLLTKIPYSLGKLESLEILEAHNNELTILPKSIGNITSLRSINLYNNRLKEIPTSIGALTKLKALFLHGNNLRKIPESIGNLSNLEILNFKKNELVEVPNSIGNINSLKVLSLRDNNLKHLPETIGNLSKLEVLDIGKNQFKSLHKPFNNLISLTAFWIDENPIEDFPQFLYKLPNLRLIGIENTNISKSSITKNSLLNKDIEIS